MKKWFKRWFEKKVVVLMTRYTSHHFEYFVGVAECRGVIYIVTTDRILRYSPDHDEFTTEIRIR